jgi:hypothetical protein
MVRFTHLDDDDEWRGGVDVNLEIQEKEELVREMNIQAENSPKQRYPFFFNAVYSVYSDLQNINAVAILNSLDRLFEISQIRHVPLCHHSKRRRR